MTSINLDLDFQDYTPTNNASTNKQHPPQYEEIQARNPSEPSTSSQKTFKQNLPNAKSVLNDLHAGANLSEETIQQLLWLSGKQKNKQQRGIIANSAGWGLGYFAQYFDVTTDDVLQRILWSAVPIRKLGIDLDNFGNTELINPLADSLDKDPSDDNQQLLEQIGGKRKRFSYMERFIQSRPDFYGPFWISTTLIFAIAILSNIVSYNDYRAKVEQVDMLNAQSSSHSLDLTNSSYDIVGGSILSESSKPVTWHYSMDELNMASSVIIFYVTLMPTFLWFLFWFRGCAKYYTLTETICAYGYSLSIFIPLSVMLMVKATLFRYLCIAMASLMSGLCLAFSFLPMIQGDPSKTGSHIILVIVLIGHMALAYIIHRIMLQ